MQRKVGAAPELSPKITLVDSEFFDDCRGRADTLVQFFEDIVVDQIDLHIFIAATLAGSGIGLAEQIEFRSSSGIYSSDLLAGRGRCGAWSGAVFFGRFRSGLGLVGSLRRSGPP